MDVLYLIAAYLAGSIPFGLLMGFARGVDIRTRGSGNIGATNAMRVLGKPLGIVCFLLDVLKGAVPVLIVGSIEGFFGRRDLSMAESWLWVGVAVFTVLGHCFPVWLRFKGGKGVATGFGAMLAAWPITTPAAVVGFVVWFATVRITRYVSLASMLGACSLPIGIALRGDLTNTLPFVLVTGLLALLVIWRHRSNIQRLMKGEEPKSGTRA